MITRAILAVTASVMLLNGSLMTETSSKVCSCGGRFLFCGTTCTTWVTQSTSGCVHKPYGTDARQKRRVTKTYVCSKCGESSYEDSFQYRTVCHGYGQ